jgi:hypothetical protein
LLPGKGGLPTGVRSGREARRRASGAMAGNLRRQLEPDHSWLHQIDGLRLAA